MNEALQAAMFFAEAEFPPNLRTTTLDEVLAVRVIVDHEAAENQAWLQALASMSY
jgi:hypothetical protein